MVERIENFAQRGKAVHISVDGKRIKAYENETVGIAILASGRSVLARSIRFHRPRSMFCSTGNCHRCLMEIDGVPNRRACTTYVEDGMVVRSQNAFPDAEKDLLSILDKFSHMLRTSIYHHNFLKPKFLRQTYLKTLKRFTGLGRLDFNKKLAEKPRDSIQERLNTVNPEIIVAGGGLTGLSAAMSAADSGASVLVIDDRKQVDGALVAKADVDLANDGYYKYRGMLADLETKVKKHPSIEFWKETTLTGIYDGKKFGIVSRNKGVAELETKRLVIATGTYDVTPVFRNNDLPGIFSARLVEQMIYEHGLKPGSRALILGSTRRALQVAQALKKADISICGFVTESQTVSDQISSMAAQMDARVWSNHEIADVKGKKKVQSVKLIEKGEGRYSQVKCDLLVICHSQPRYELQAHADCDLIFDDQRGGLVAQVDDRLQSTQPWIYVAGDALGPEKGLSLCVAEGVLAGYYAAEDLGFTIDKQSLNNYRKAEQKYQNQEEVEPISVNLKNKDGHVCFCQDVKLDEILKEKDDIQKENLKDFHTELIKRRTGILTGPCQGKQCLSNFLRTLAAADDGSPLDHPVPTVRPPIVPLSINKIGAGEKDEEN